MGITYIENRTGLLSEMSYFWSQRQAWSVNLIELGLKLQSKPFFLKTALSHVLSTDHHYLKSANIYVYFTNMEDLCEASGFVITTEHLGFVVTKQVNDFLLRVYQTYPRKIMSILSIVNIALVTHLWQTSHIESFTYVIRLPHYITWRSDFPFFSYDISQSSVLQKGWNHDA